MVVVFFNDTATTEIYTLSLHDALPIFTAVRRAIIAKAPTSIMGRNAASRSVPCVSTRRSVARSCGCLRSEEHTSELQSRQYLVCRLLLEKKKLYPEMMALRRRHQSPAQ